MIRPRGEVGRAIVDRLLAASDEVRVLEDDTRLTAQWRASGTFLALGSPVDEDLVERAAQDVRTVVIVEPADFAPEELSAILRGAENAGVDRIVWCGAEIRGARLEALERWSKSYVAAWTPRKLFTAKRVSPAAVAAAVDAADDLAGGPQLRLDLSSPASWKALRLDPPD